MNAEAFALPRSGDLRPSQDAPKTGSALMLLGKSA